MHAPCVYFTWLIVCAVLSAETDVLAHYSSVFACEGAWGPVDHKLRTQCGCNGQARVIPIITNVCSHHETSTPASPTSLGRVLRSNSTVTNPGTNLKFVCLGTKRLKLIHVVRRQSLTVGLLRARSPRDAFHSDGPRWPVSRSGTCRGSSGSVRLFPLCCLQQGVFEPIDDGRGGQSVHSGTTVVTS